jgi:hypothetical protein
MIVKPVLKIVFYILLLGVLIHVSCKRELFCEECKEKNKPPIAIAGPDRVIALPTDSVLLDGSASSDPDGKISSYLWTKISGPVSFALSNATAVTMVVKNLVTGVYQFELMVTDNGGLSATDTVQIFVNKPAQSNRAPVANAGADQAITWPTNAVILNGSGSIDPDNDIIGYTWTKISGPALFNIVTPGVA